MFSKILPHVARIRHQLGREVTFGKEHFNVRGYYANRLNTSDRHEQNLTQVLARYLHSRRGAFIDVGVNTGQTLCKVLGIDRTRQYVGFEPQIGCCFFVDQFLQENGLSNAAVLPIALSDANGIFTLWSSSAYDEMASLSDRHNDTGITRSHATHVTARLGDEVLEELGVEEICVVKVDVEGAERKVLTGLSKTLRTRRPTVFFEVLPNFFGHDRVRVDASLAASNTIEADAIYAFFSALDYEVLQIDEKSGESLISRFELNDRERYVSFNYLARPKR